jgi:hypothetical protein
MASDIEKAVGKIKVEQGRQVSAPHNETTPSGVLRIKDTARILSGAAAGAVKLVCR